MRSQLRFVPQRSYNQCAVACVKMLTSVYGGELSYDGIRLFLPEKASIFDVRRVLMIEGIGSQTYRSLDRDINTLTKLPIMMHLKSLVGYHFVIIEKVEGNRSFILDPGRCKPRWVSNKYLKRHWTGYFVCIGGVMKPITKKNHYIPYPIRLFLLSLVLYAILVMIFIRLLIV